MKKLSLVKEHTTHDLAHLYEHIYYIYADTYLRGQGLFAPLDYSLDAFTDDGVIHIDCELYNNFVDENSIFDTLQNLDIDFDVETTDIALKQLECEYAHAITITSTENFYQALHNLHTSPWNKQGSNTYTNVSEDENCMLVGDKIMLCTVRVAISLQKVDLELSPLLRQVAGIIINAYISDVADTYGGFVNSKVFQVNKFHEIEGIVLIQKTSLPSGDELRELFFETIDEIIQAKGFERLLASLQNIDNLELPPSPERTLHDTGVQMNTQKWKQLATEQNLIALLAIIKSETQIHIL